MPLVIVMISLSPAIGTAVDSDIDVPVIVMTTSLPGIVRTRVEMSRQRWLL